MRSARSLEPPGLAIIVHGWISLNTKDAVKPLAAIRSLLLPLSQTSNSDQAMDQREETEGAQKNQARSPTARKSINRHADKQRDPEQTQYGVKNHRLPVAAQQYGLIQSTFGRAVHWL